MFPQPVLEEAIRWMAADGEENTNRYVLSFDLHAPLKMPPRVATVDIAMLARGPLRPRDG